MLRPWCKSILTEDHVDIYHEKKVEVHLHIPYIWHLLKFAYIYKIHKFNVWMS